MGRGAGAAAACKRMQARQKCCQITFPHCLLLLRSYNVFTSIPYGWAYDWVYWVYGSVYSIVCLVKLYNNLSSYTMRGKKTMILFFTKK